MNWNQAITQKRQGRKYPMLTRIKVGRAISAWAAIPFNASLWMMPIGLAMSVSLSPTVWAKSKLIDFKEWRSLW